MNKCSICKKEVDREDAPILTMGAYGIPRLLCDECAYELDVATTDTDFDRIADAMDKLSAKMGACEPEALVISTVSGIISDAAKRANSIKDGSYDFSLDESEDAGFDEIPEDMLETEEDKEIDRVAEERAKKFDKVFNIVAAIIFSAVCAFLVYRIFDTFIF